jgi:hypothetical protein
MGAEESSINERISIVGREYSVLRKDIKFHQCGWSNVNPKKLISASSRATISSV